LHKFGRKTHQTTSHENPNDRFIRDQKLLKKEQKKHLALSRQSKKKEIVNLFKKILKNKFGKFNHIINSLNYSNFNFLSSEPKLIYDLTKLEVSRKFDYSF